MASIVKHSYLKAGAEKLARAHLKYLRHRSGDDKSERSFFSSDSQDDIDVNDIYSALAEVGKHGVLIHKLVLSPGVNNCDLKDYAREVMQSLDSHTGLDLKWVGVEHRHTDHAHVHVVILGRDLNGRQVRISKQNYKQLREAGDRYLWSHQLIERKLNKPTQRKYQPERVMSRLRIGAWTGESRERATRGARTNVRNTNTRSKPPTDSQFSLAESKTRFRNWLGLSLKQLPNTRSLTRSIDEIVKRRPLLPDML